MKKMILGGTVVLLVASLMSGCVHRNVRLGHPSSTHLAATETWNTPLARGTRAKPADDATLSHWWATLGDPVLTSLEERAVSANLDVRRAETRIRQARANRNAAVADLLPSYEVNGSGTGSRPSTRAQGEFSQLYSAAVNASWEPDFWGKLRASAIAYEADLQAAEEDLRNTLVALTADVALNYVDVRSLQAQLSVTKENLAKFEDTHGMTVAKYESGISTELDVQQALQAVETTRAEIPNIETSIRRACNAIAVLLAERPGTIDAELDRIKPVPPVPVEVAIGIPADLVRRRPDIRGAERQFAAQKARVAVAQANLYPSLTLSGTFSFGSKNILNLLTPATLASSLAGTVQQNVFNRRKLREQVNAQNAALDQSELSYENAVLGAIKDVEDALQSFGAEQVRRKSLSDAAKAAANSAEMARELYQAGLRDFLTVLDSERSVLSLQNSLVQSDADIVRNLIRLYKAIGGGWQ